MPVEHNLSAIGGGDAIDDSNKGCFACSIRTKQSVEGQFNVINHTHSGDLHTYTLQKAEQLTNSQLISAVANHIELRSISEQMPSMQEIFLKTVQQTNDHE